VNDFHEAGQAPHRRFVDTRHRCAGDRRLDVPRVHHAGQLDVHRPFRRSVNLAGNVVALRRLAGHLHVLDGLQLRLARRRVHVVAREYDVEVLAADQLPVSHGLRRIGFQRDHRIAHGELIDRDGESRCRQLEQHPSRLGGDTPHRPAVSLQRVGASRSALVDRNVGVAHDDAGLVERDVEFVGHDLAEGGAGALSEIRLANVERRRVVRANDDPRIELMEIGIRVRARGG
jgi:hypothetical protein